MKLRNHFFQSEKSQNLEYGPFFHSQEEIQSSLHKICNAWVTHLQCHIEQTNILFQSPEHPWEDVERAIVSTLAAAIIRSFSHSLVLEECRVEKPGFESNQNASKSSNAGRCDLWATIPELKVCGKEFSFYLEAKKSVTPKTAVQLSHYLNTDRGVSRLFNDYLKSNPGKIRKLSPYSKLKSRKHEHYVISMLVMPLKRTDSDLDDEVLFTKIDNTIRDIFKLRLPIKVKGSSKDAEPVRRRRMFRYPTVALTIAPVDRRAGEDRPTGMIAIFTVFGATKNLLADKTNV